MFNYISRKPNVTKVFFNRLNIREGKNIVSFIYLIKKMLRFATLLGLSASATSATYIRGPAATDSILLADAPDDVVPPSVPATADATVAAAAAPPTLSDHIQHKEEIAQQQTDLESTYATTKAELKQEKNDVIADIQNKKRENLETAITSSSIEAEGKKEQGEKDAMEEEEEGTSEEEAGPSEAEQAAAAAAKAAAKTACGGDNTAQQAQTPEEKVAAEEAAQKTKAKAVAEAKEASTKVETMVTDAKTHIASTTENLSSHAQSLEDAKKVSGGCPKAKKKEEEKVAAAADPKSEKKVEEKAAATADPKAEKKVEVEEKLF